MNTANKLTLLRFLLSAIFIGLFYADFKYSMVIMTAIFLVASVTDFLDGYIARKFDQITKLGKLMDPLADKVLVFSALLIFVEMKLIPAFPVIIILSRDLMIGIFRAVAASDGVVISANIYGKAKTVVQMVSVTALLVGLSVDVEIIQDISVIGIYISTLLAVVSGVIYVNDNKAVLK